MNETMNIEVNDLTDDVEYINISYDRRYDVLSQHTRCVIAALFDGDIDMAEHAAEREFQNYRVPAQWAVEVHGASRHGWKEWT